MKTINFTWRKIYANVAGIALCFLLIWLTAFIGMSVEKIFRIESVEGDFILCLTAFVLMGGCIIFSIVMSRRFNHMMMSKAVKNQQVICEYLNGAYEDKIPARMKTAEGRQRILNYLVSGKATSVTGAVWMARKKKADKVVFGGLFAIFGFVFRAVDKMISEEFEACGHAIGGAIGNVTGSISSGTVFDNIGSGASVTEDNTWKITREKNRAVAMRTQAQNAAMAAPGSYNAQRRAELANQQRIKANNMWKQNF